MRKRNKILGWRINSNTFIPLNQIEIDFIEFMSQTLNITTKDMKKKYIDTKYRFDFSSPEYREFADNVHNLFRLQFDDNDEQGSIKAYRFHALLQVFRLISYSFPKKTPTFTDYVKMFNNLVQKGEWQKILLSIDSKLHKISINSKNLLSQISAAKLLRNNSKKNPIIVDYGCGLGYLSFELAMRDKGVNVYLLDINCLTLEFASYRFKKYGIKAEEIIVDENNIYPKLPVHDICIATEVMEHLFRPLVAYENISQSLSENGLLYGNFSDHRKEMFHVSHDLSKLRSAIERDFEQLGENLFRKKIKK